MSHAIRIPITTETDNDQSLVLGHDGLVDVPAGNEMGKYDGAHIGCVPVARWLRVEGCGFDLRFGKVEGYSSSPN